MNNLNINRRIVRLTSGFTNALSATDNPEFQAQWARYYCILTAGVLETAIRELFSEYCKRCASPKAARYSLNQLSWFQNPNTEKIKSLIYTFDSNWGDQINTHLSSEGRGEAIDGIINTRHQIAHGQDTGISPAILKDYMRRALETLDFIEQMLRMN